MRFFRRIAGFLGFAKEDGTHEVKHQEGQEDDDDHNQNHQGSPRGVNFQETGLPRKGFSVQVAVERPQLAPLIASCSSGDGGVQGLQWYAKRLRIDEDGDVADEFLDEVLPEPSSSADDQQHKKPFPRFQVKYSARPVKIKKQVMSDDGKIKQCVEHQGRLQWV